MESRILTKRAIEALNTAQTSITDAEKAVAVIRHPALVARLIRLEWEVVGMRRAIREAAK